MTDLLREIMTEARKLTKAERCSLFLLEAEQQELVAKVFDGLPTEDVSNFLLYFVRCVIIFFKLFIYLCHASFQLSSVVFYTNNIDQIIVDGIQNIFI